MSPKVSGDNGLTGSATKGQRWWWVDWVSHQRSAVMMGWLGQPPKVSGDNGLTGSATKGQRWWWVDWVSHQRSAVMMGWLGQSPKVSGDDGLTGSATIVVSLQLLLNLLILCQLKFDFDETWYKWYEDTRIQRYMRTQGYKWYEDTRIQRYSADFDYLHCINCDDYAC